MQSISILHIRVYVWAKQHFVHDRLCPHRFRIRAELLCGVFCLVLLFVNLILVGNAFNRSMNTYMHSILVCVCVHSSSYHTHITRACERLWMVWYGYYSVLDVYNSIYREFTTIKFVDDCITLFFICYFVCLFFFLILLLLPASCYSAMWATDFVFFFPQCTTNDIFFVTVLLCVCLYSCWKVPMPGYRQDKL